MLILHGRHCGAQLDGVKGLELRAAEWVGVERIHAAWRHKRCWTRPFWTDDPGELPSQCQYILARRDGASDGRYLAILPLVDGGMRGEVRGSEGQGAIAAVSLDSQFVPCGFALAAVAVGDDPYELTERIFASALRSVCSGRARREKSVPGFVEQFGWCSWNAFYQDVTEQNVIDALTTFAAGEMPVGFYILDDGWQDVQQYQAHKPDGEEHKPWGLASFRANDKFGAALSGLIDRVKSQTDLKYFGVWHALQGYWGGLCPRGELFGDYEVYSDVWEHQIVKPKDTYRFFQDYHSYLRGQGVDMVKVDNQSGLEGNVEGCYAVGHAARRAHQALDGSAAVHFRNEMINCMSMSNDLMLQMPFSNVARNSDDYYPNRPDNVGDHIVCNAYNNLWVGQLVIPDWDMFESHHPYGRFHAIARAISGSPIYCTDTPGKQDFDLLRKLALSDGSALRCPEPAQVCQDTLMRDPLNEATLLKVSNLLPTGHGLLGLFNCRLSEPVEHDEKSPYAFSDEQRQALSASTAYGPTDVRGLEAGRLAVFSHRDRTLRLMDPAERDSVELVKYEAELLVLAPIERDAAVLGLIDKFNSPAAIETWGFDGEALLVQLRDGGEAGFYCAARPRQVLINEQEIPSAQYDENSGLLTVQVPVGAAAVVQLNW